MPATVPTLTDVVVANPASPPLPGEARVPEQRAVRTPPALQPRVAARSVGMSHWAIGALAFGALAIGALAIGRLAIQRLALRHAHIAHLQIDDLDVRRLRVSEPDARWRR